MIVEIILLGILILFSSVIVWEAVYIFELGSNYLGRNLSNGVKGATINAIGSSIPEFLTTFIFLFFLKDIEGFTSGFATTSGSGIFNVLVIPSLIIMTVILFSKKNITIQKKVLLRDIGYLLLVEIILLWIIWQGKLTFWNSFGLVLLYIGYLSILFFKKNKPPFHQLAQETHSVKKWVKIFFLIKKISTLKAWIMLFVSIIIMSVGCFILVYACENLAIVLQIPIYFIAIIIAAIATSFPDTILSIKDAKKGFYDDALSNVFGSNIFDMCFALGLPVLLYTLIFNDIVLPYKIKQDAIELSFIVIIMTIITFLIFIIGKKIGLFKSLLLLGLYLFFVIWIIYKAYN